MDHGRFKWGRKKPLVLIFKMTTTTTTTVVMLVISYLDSVNSEVMNFLLSMPLLCRLKYCIHKPSNTDYKIYALKP
jgi:hypothetical protein